MRELRAVALSEDGGYLVLADAGGRTDGEQFRVPVDDRLRAALRGMRRSEVRTESALTPREIQARLRAGETAAEVARAAGIPVERVERYEGPVLAERARVVQEARAALLPKDPGGVPGRPLGEVVDARLIVAQDNPAAAQWDAWRRVDGIWLVQLTSDSRCARWTWDPVVRRVRPHDDAARALVAPESTEQAPPPPPAPPVLRAAGPALTLVSDQGLPATPAQPAVAAAPLPAVPQEPVVRPHVQPTAFPAVPAAAYPAEDRPSGGGGTTPQRPAAVPPAAATMRHPSPRGDGRWQPAPREHWDEPARAETFRAVPEPGPAAGHDDPPADYTADYTAITRPEPDPAGAAAGRSADGPALGASTRPAESWAAPVGGEAAGEAPDPSLPAEEAGARRPEPQTPRRTAATRVGSLSRGTGRRVAPEPGGTRAGSAPPAAAPGRAAPAARSRPAASAPGAAGSARTGGTSRAAVAQAGTPAVTSATSPAGSAAVSGPSAAAESPTGPAGPVVTPAGRRPRQADDAVAAAPSAGGGASTTPTEESARTPAVSPPSGPSVAEGAPGAAVRQRRGASAPAASDEPTSTDPEESTTEGVDESTTEKSGAPAASRGRQNNGTRGGERPAGGRRGRKSVPAWDDIVFGARRP
ncbi:MULTISPECIES: septation protein SepH [Frankia]|uniref:DNA-binding protein n=2 Tax=Frankia TaxID=1854 RepID=Q0RE00_FRAAA|nr:MULTISPECIES: septation protein SepH [Frankia]CAJ64316.1 Putative DNA-binding protein [Frankia alni ACN14a]